MEIQVKVARFRSMFDFDIFMYTINDSNFLIAREKLKQQRTMIIDYLKDLYHNGKIKNYRRPKCKGIQKQLDSLIKVKRILKESIDKINLVF